MQSYCVDRFFVAGLCTAERSATFFFIKQRSRPLYVEQLDDKNTLCVYDLTQEADFLVQYLSHVAAFPIYFILGLLHVRERWVWWGPYRIEHRLTHITPLQRPPSRQCTSGQGMSFDAKDKFVSAQNVCSCYPCSVPVWVDNIYCGRWSQRIAFYECLCNVLCCVNKYNNNLKSLVLTVYLGNTFQLHTVRVTLFTLQ